MNKIFFRSLILIFLLALLFLSACGKHNKTEFKIQYECADKVCSIYLDPLDSTYQQDLITDQLLYSNEYPKNEVKTNIKWYTQESTSAVLVDNKTLGDDSLPDCFGSKCTLYSNPTGFKFNTQSTSAKVYVHGQATIKNNTYPISLSTTLKFANIAAPKIAIKGICDSTDLNCKFYVVDKITGGTSPYQYRWYLNNKEISTTKSNDKKGDLSYTFKTFGSVENLYMIAVDKHGDHSAKSNILPLSGPKVTSMSVSPTNVRYDPTNTQTITYTASVTGGTGTNIYTWPTLTKIKTKYSDITAVKQVDSTNQSKYTLTVKKDASNEKISANDIKLIVTNDGGTGSGVAHNDIQIQGSAVAPKIDNIDVSPTTVYFEDNSQQVTYTASASSPVSGNTIDPNTGYRWTVKNLPNGITYIKNNSHKLILTVPENKGDAYDIPSDDISVIAIDDKGNSSNPSSPSLVKVEGYEWTVLLYQSSWGYTGIVSCDTCNKGGSWWKNISGDVHWTIHLTKGEKVSYRKTGSSFLYNWKLDPNTKVGDVAKLTFGGAITSNLYNSTTRQNMVTDPG